MKKLFRNAGALFFAAQISIAVGSVSLQSKWIDEDGAAWTSITEDTVVMAVTEPFAWFDTLYEVVEKKDQALTLCLDHDYNAFGFVGPNCFEGIVPESSSKGTTKSLSFVVEGDSDFLDSLNYRLAQGETIKVSFTDGLYFYASTLNQSFKLNDPLPAQDIERDSIIEKVASYEGISTGDVDSLAISDILKSIVVSQGQEPSVEVLTAPYLKGFVNDETQAYFVLGLLAASYSEKAEEAITLLQNADLPSTYYEDKSIATNSEGLREYAYAWLLNHPSPTVPRELVEQHPELINTGTPYWYATRDGYFSVEKPDGRGWFNSDAYDQWFSLLTDIESPDEDAWLGSVRNARFKDKEKLTALMFYAPDYFDTEVSDFGELAWVECWGRLGPYEHNKIDAYKAAKKKVAESIATTLIRDMGIEPEQSKRLSDKWISGVEKTFIGRVSRSKPSCVGKIELAEQGKWQDALIGVTEYEPEYVQLIGNSMSAKHPDELPRFLASVQGRFPSAVIDEIRSYAIVVSGVENAQILPEASHVWGYFNKTPLMYALQLNQAKAVDWLLKSEPGMVDERTIESTDYFFGPTITARTSAMYAAEYSDRWIIEKIIESSSTDLLSSTDSEGRNVLHYLARNEQLDKAERLEIVRKLFAAGFVSFEPSFDCKKASDQYELLACSTELNAATDKELNKVYKEVRAKLSSSEKEDLKVSQRNWIRTERGKDLLISDRTDNFAYVVQQRIEAIKAF